MIITYKGTLQTVYETEVNEELGRTRKTLKEVYLKSEDGNHDIPESIEKKLRYRIEHRQLKEGDTYEFTIDWTPIDTPPENPGVYLALDQDGKTLDLHWSDEIPKGEFVPAQDGVTPKEGRLRARLICYWAEK